MATVIIFRGVATFDAMFVARRAVRDLTRDVVVAAKLRASIGPYATGYLASRIRSEINDVPGGVEGIIRARTKYSNAVEHGAKPHMIYPHGNYPLRFFWRKAGRVVRLSRVHHPGQRPKRYLRDALEVHAPRHGFKIIVQP